MKERPILFSAPMVRAILAGTKTQTRRAWKLPRGCEWYGEMGGQQAGWFVDVDPGAPWWLHVSECRCPYGQPGDRLWVRETWYCDDYRVQRGPYLKPDDLDLDQARNDGTLIYRASSGDRPYEAEQPTWRPAIHMPRWASRITLEVTGVRVERLQDISEADAIAEGIELRRVSESDSRWVRYGRDRSEGLAYSTCGDPRESYLSLWEQINGPGSWDANPWVWAIDIKRITAC